MNDVLGNPSYEIVLANRGGAGTRALTEEFAALRWTRGLDALTSASVVLSPDCGQGWWGATPWAHELLIYRCGILVWGGPVVEVEIAHDGITIDARDLTAWWERREVSLDQVFSGADAAAVFASIAADAMRPDSSPNIALDMRSTSIAVTRELVASQHARSADLLRELARTAVDYTAVGRTIVYGGREINTPSLRQLGDDDLDRPRLSRQGLEAASSVTVTGSNDAIATVSRPFPTTGLLLLQIDEPDILDPASADASAQTHLANAYPYPQSLSADLTPVAPGVESLIPGAHAPVRCVIGSVVVDSVFRLGEISVSVQAESVEVVSATFLPLGST